MDSWKSKRKYPLFMKNKILNTNPYFFEFKKFYFEFKFLWKIPISFLINTSLLTPETFIYYFNTFEIKIKICYRKIVQKDSILNNDYIYIC